MGFSKIINIAKNPILKYLSKFAKNLSPEHLKLSVLRGEGELSNLELDEAAIMALLDLPPWLSLRSARCNRVSIRCQWTKLKKVPISIRLDQVVVEVEALETPRSATAAAAREKADAKYGFADKVIDGMEVAVNSVRILVSARAFNASVELSKLQVYSVMANWARGDLKFTYLRDRARDQILVFKEVVWDTTRIEAGLGSSAAASSIRLVTNRSRVRVAIKKRLSDSRLLASRTELLLDDLLWVLTVSQLEATVLLVKSLQACIDRSARVTRKAAADRLAADQRQQPSSQRESATDTLGPSERIFREFDVHETSYHVHTGRVDLHLCEDCSADSRLSENSVANGAVQLTLLKLSMDFHPLHPFDCDRSERRLQFSDSHRKSHEWIRGRLEWLGCPTQQLTESTLVLRLQDASVSCVASPGSSRRPNFLASDKRRLQLPPNSLTAFVEFADFGFADGRKTEPPPAAIFVQLNPMHLRLHCDTVLWLHAFCQRLSASLKTLASAESADSADPADCFLFALEATFPRVILAAKCERPDHPERPSSLEILSNSLALTNCCDSIGQQAAAAADACKRLAMSAFPQVPDAFPQAASDSAFDWAGLLAPCRPGLVDCVWRLSCQQLWCEFAGAKALRPRQQTFVQPLPLVLFARPRACDCLALLHLPAGSLNLLLTHYQYLFLMRIVEDFADCAARAEADRAAIDPTPATKSELLVWLSWQQLHCGVVLPALCESRVLPQSPLPPTSQLGQPKLADKIRISDCVRCVQLEDPPINQQLPDVQPQALEDSARPSLGHASFSSPFLGKLSNQVRGFGQRLGRAVGHGSTGNLSDSADWDAASESSGLSSELERGEQLRFILDATREPCDSRDGLSDRLTDPDVPSAEADSPVSASSSSSCRDTVSCLTVSAVDAAAFAVVSDAGSLVTACARHLRLRESGNVSYEELLTDPTPRQQDGEDSDASGASLRLRAFLDARRTETCTADSIVHLQLQDARLQLTMSSVTNLADFVEDELLYAAVPLRLQLLRLQLQLREDRPCTNLSCPGEHPVTHLELPHLDLYRDVKEVFHLLTDPEAASRFGPEVGVAMVNSVAKENSVARENSVPRENSVAMGNSTQATHVADPDAALVQKENHKLQFLLAQCQDEIDYLRRERESLLKALNATQAELHRRQQQAPIYARNFFG